MNLLRKLWEILVKGNCRWIWMDYYRRGIINREEMLKRIEECDTRGES